MRFPSSIRKNPSEDESLESAGTLLRAAMGQHSPVKGVRAVRIGSSAWNSDFMVWGRHILGQVGFGVQEWCLGEMTSSTRSYSFVSHWT